MISVDGIVWDPSAQIDLAEEGLLTDGMCSVVAASNKTSSRPDHSQLLQTIKGHHMSLVALSWQMTWLESKSATDERGVSKESRNIARELRIERSVATNSEIMIIIEQRDLTLKELLSLTITLLHHEKGISLLGRGGY